MSQRFRSIKMNIEGNLSMLHQMLSMNSKMFPEVIDVLSSAPDHAEKLIAPYQAAYLIRIENRGLHTL